MRKYSWTKHLKRSAPELPYDSPIYLGNWSNGEFFVQARSGRRVRRLSRSVAGSPAHAWSDHRREFLNLVRWENDYHPRTGKI
jgi:hypothetical protein